MPGEPVPRVSLGVLRFLKEPSLQGSSRHPPPGFLQSFPIFFGVLNLQSFASLESSASLQSFASWKGVQVLNVLVLLQNFHNICFWRSLVGKPCTPSELVFSLSLSCLQLVFSLSSACLQLVFSLSNKTTVTCDSFSAPPEKLSHVNYGGLVLRLSFTCF